MNKLSVVIPCYNSENNIKEVIESDKSIFAIEGICDYEFILVNDCSKDNTWGIIRQLSNDNENILAINLAKNVGQHGAIMAGLRRASGDYVVVSEDDGQTQMSAIGQMMEKLNEGYDFVSTEWVNRGHRSLFRKIGSFLSSSMTNFFLDNPRGEAVSIFFVARRFIVDEIVKYSGPYPFITGLLLRTTHNFATVSVNQLDRASGKSGYTFKKLISLWANGFTAFSIVPLRCATYLGAISAMIGFITGIVVIVRKILVDNLAVGWSSTVAIMLFMFGIVLCVLGMIGEYLGRIYMCINEKPQYVIKEIVGEK